MTYFTGTTFKNYWPSALLCMTCLLTWPNLADADPAQIKHPSQTQTQKKIKQTDNHQQNKFKNSTVRSEKELEIAVRRLIEAYQQEQNASALVHCKHAIEVMPDDTQESLKTSLMMTCIELMTKNEMHEDALEFARRIQQTGVSEMTKQGLCFMEATSLTKLHRWQEARQKYTECPGKTDEERSIIESNMAELAMIEGDSASAVTMYQTSLVHDDNNPHAAYGLAVALAREKQYEKAHKAFLDGVKFDPGFTFLKDAFFEPKAENDFQTAFRMIAMRRLPEARFYLEKYIDMEQRPAYKALGIHWLERIKAQMQQGKDLKIAQYPVLLEHIRSIALNSQGTLIAFLTLEKSSDYDFITVIWVLNTQNGRTRRRLVLPETMISDMTFVENTNHLKLLGTQYRYELDAASHDNAYYLYENDPETLPLFLTPSGQKIGRMRDNLDIELATWTDNADSNTTIWKTAVEMNQLRISSDGRSLGYKTPIGAHIASVATGEAQHHMLPARFEVNDIAVHPSKDIFILGMRTGTLIVDHQGNILELYGSPFQMPVSNLAVSPDGQKIAALSEQTVEIWHLNDANRQALAMAPEFHNESTAMENTHP